MIQEVEIYLSFVSRSESFLRLSRSQASQKELSKTLALTGRAACPSFEGLGPLELMAVQKFCPQLTGHKPKGLNAIPHTDSLWTQKSREWNEATIWLRTKTKGKEIYVFSIRLSGLRLGSFSIFDQQHFSAATLVLLFGLYCGGSLGIPWPENDFQIMQLESYDRKKISVSETAATLGLLLSIRGNTNNTGADTRVMATSCLHTRFSLDSRLGQQIREDYPQWFRDLKFHFMPELVKISRTRKRKWGAWLQVFFLCSIQINRVVSHKSWARSTCNDRIWVLKKIQKRNPKNKPEWICPWSKQGGSRGLLAPDPKIFFFKTIHVATQGQTSASASWICAWDQPSPDPESCFFFVFFFNLAVCRIKRRVLMELRSLTWRLDMWILDPLFWQALNHGSG